MSRPLALLLTTLALGLAACGDDEESTSVQAPPAGEATATTEAPAPSGPGDCTTIEEATGDRAQPCPTPSLEDGTNVVTFKTSEGTFEVTLDTKRAPVTANSFAYLVKQRFFDGLVFHRVVPDFVIQGGDPVGDTAEAGSGGPGYRVTEPPPSELKYTRGVVAMAKTASDPSGASGSQFYVVSGPDAGLDPDYALVGKVTKGLGTVDEINALGEGDGPPSKTVRITSATLSGS